MREKTLIREKLMTVPGYAPFCGSNKCYLRWPRTKFNGQQFSCMCGWTSSFDPIFIGRYKRVRRQQEAKP